MTKIYIISNQENISENRFMFGCHKDSEESLISKYNIFIPNPKVLYFESHSDSQRIVSSIEEEYKSLVDLRDNDGSSTWYICPYGMLVDKIREASKIQEEQSMDLFLLESSGINSIPFHCHVEVIRSKSGLLSTLDVERFLLERCLIFTEAIHERKKSLIRTLHQVVFDNFLTFTGRTSRDIRPPEFRELLQFVVDAHQLQLLYCRSGKGMCWEGLILRERVEQAQQSLEMYNRTRDSNDESSRKRRSLESRIKFLIDDEIISGSSISRRSLFEISNENLKKYIWRVDVRDLPWNLLEEEMLLEYSRDIQELFNIYVDIETTTAETAVRWKFHEKAKGYMEKEEARTYSKNVLSVDHRISQVQVNKFMISRLPEQKKSVLEQVLISMNMSSDDIGLVSIIRHIFVLTCDRWDEMIQGNPSATLEEKARVVGEFILGQLRILHEQNISSSTEARVQQTIISSPTVRLRILQ